MTEPTREHFDAALITMEAQGYITATLNGEALTGPAFAEALIGPEANDILLDLTDEGREYYEAGNAPDPYPFTP